MQDQMYLWHDPQENKENSIEWKLREISLKNYSRDVAFSDFTYTPHIFLDHSLEDHNRNFHQKLVAFSNNGEILWQKKLRPFFSHFSDKAFFECACFSFEGNLVCVFRETITIFDFNGKIIKEASMDFRQYRDYEKNVDVHTSVCMDERNGNLIVALRSELDGVQIWDKSLNLILTIDDVYDPHSVAVDGNGNIVISDRRQLIFFSEKGEFQFCVEHKNAVSVFVDLEGNLLVTTTNTMGYDIIVTYYKWV